MRAIALGCLLTICSAAPPQGDVAARIRIPPDGGPLYVTIKGTEKKIAANALKAWLTDSGRSVAYSTASGAGGFEGEGQALYLYDVGSGHNSKLLTEFFEITGVVAVKSARGKTAFLVTMEDGGLGASHVAVADPGRGEVFREDGAKFAASSPGAIMVALYKDEDWDKLRDKVAVKPYKTQRYDVDELLRRSVIVNKAPR